MLITTNSQVFRRAFEENEEPIVCSGFGIHVLGVSLSQV